MILTNELFHIIPPLQKSCLERKESPKLKSTQISIGSRRALSFLSDPARVILVKQSSCGLADSKGS